MRRLLLGLALLLVPAGPALAKPPVWVVRDADSTIVIFGSVHLLPKGLDWTPQELTQALAVADDLWFEMPVDPQSEAASTLLAAQRGVLPQGQSLSAMLSPRGRERLARLAPRLGLSIAEVDRLRPWLAEVALTLGHLKREGAVGLDGVEKQIAAAAPASAQRRAFETAAEQIALFADTPVADQVASLEESLREIDKSPKAYRELLDAWMKGDLKTIERQGLKRLKRKAPAMYRRLITARNIRWTDTITRRLAGSGETVIVVGAGHLVGPDGVPARLRARGIAVEGPK